MLPTVSYIIPVYNAEKTLRESVRSVAEQNYRALEIILVDDGSKDDSGAICDELAASDARIKVIHKPNGGVSSARNAAISAATGEYVAFADSDDTLPPDSAEKLVAAITENGAELAVGGFIRVWQGIESEKSDIKQPGAMSLRDFALVMLEKPSDFYFGVLWNKLFKRELLTGMAFDETLSWCEDYVWNLEYLARVKTVAVVDAPVYRYFDNKGSLTKKNVLSASMRETRLYVYEKYKSFYESIGMCETPADKLRVAGYLVSIAGDGVVTPTKPFERLLKNEKGEK